jgi:hypothetical protein
MAPLFNFCAAGTRVKIAVETPSQLSTLCFNRDCCVAKSELRRLEYKSLDAAKKSDVFAAAAAHAAWIDNRRTYRPLLRNKCEAF